MSINIEALLDQADQVAQQADELARKATTMRQGALACAIRAEHPEAHCIELWHFDGDLSDDIPASVQVMDEPDMIFTKDGTPIEGAVAPEWAIGMAFDPDSVDSRDGVAWIILDKAMKAIPNT